MNKSFRIIAVSLCVTTYVLIWAYVVSAQETSISDDVPLQNQYVPGEVIVKLKEPVGTDSTDQNEDTFSSVYKLTFDEKTSVEDVINELETHPEVEYAEPNYIVHTSKTPNDPFYTKQWYLNTPNGLDIDAPETWDITTGSSTVIVAVIDSGIEFTHPDLSNNIWVNPQEISDNNLDDDGNGFIDDIKGWDFINNDNDPFDDYLHGTVVSGVIAALGDNSQGIAGIAWNTKLMSVKTVTSNGYGNSDSGAQGIVYAVDNGAQILNISWGGYQSYVIADAIQYAKTKGVLVVASAGNSGINNDGPFGFYPVTDPSDNVISVASVNENGDIPPYSNYGSQSVDLGAPGNNIYSTSINGQYGSFSGTSLAAPVISGTAALLLSYFPDASYLDIRKRILGTVIKNNYLTSKTVTSGIVNIYEAITCILLSSQYTLLEYKTISSSSDDYAADMVQEANGFRYLVGNFANSLTIGNYELNTTTGNDQDAFVAKFDVNQNVIWVKQIGNDLNVQSVNNISIDASGNVYILGEFSNSITVDSETIINSNGQIFTMKISPEGQIEWLRNPPNDFSPEGIGIKVDSQNNYYVITKSLSTDMYKVVKFSPEGLVLWEKSDYFPIHDFIVDSSDNIIVLMGNRLIKYDSNGILLYSKEQNNTQLIKSAIDSDDNIYILGSNSSFGNELSVIKFDPSGNYLWARTITGPSVFNSVKYLIETDTKGYIYIYGASRNSVKIDRQLLLHNTGFALDPFIFILDQLGTAVGGLFFSGTDEVQPAQFILSNQSVLLYGTYSGALNVGDINLPDTNSQDIFLIKINQIVPETTPTPSISISPTPINTTLRGDANVDGKIMAYDAALIARHVDNIELISGQGLENAKRTWEPFDQITQEDAQAIAYCVVHGKQPDSCYEGFMVRTTTLLGDTDNSNSVTIQDLSKLLSYFGQPATWQEEDVNNDDSVTLSDLSLQLSNFGISN